MQKFLLKIGMYALVSFMILNLIAWATLYFIGKSSLYKPEYVANKVNERDFDYVVLGSSTGLTTLNTQLIDSITGRKGFNSSIDDTSMSTHYLMLQHFYASGKTTKKLVLVLSPGDAMEENPKLNNNDYRFLPYVYRNYVFDYYREMEKGWFKTLTYSRYVPVLGVSYYNTELFYPSLVTMVYPEKRNRFDEKGNYSYPNSGNIPEVTKENRIHVQLKNPFLERIAQFCIQHKIALILYWPPVYKTKVDVKTDFIVINHSDLLIEASSFYDVIHVNQKGRTRASNFFAQEFVKLTSNENE